MSRGWKRQRNAAERMLVYSGVRYLLPILLFPSYLVPATILAQPFDLDRVKGCIVRVIADGGNRIGSGSIIKVENKNGYILTAHHVIQNDVDLGVSHVKVELFTEHVLKARISEKRMNTDYDVAVLKVENLPSPLPPAIDWGSSKALHELQTVYAVGHRVDVSWAVTDGTVSVLQGGKIYFSGTAVNQGNSGGPLLNEQGELVGMNLRLGEGLGSALEGDVIRGIIRRWVGGFVEEEPSKPIPESPRKPPPISPGEKEKLREDLIEILGG